MYIYVLNTVHSVLHGIMMMAFRIIECIGVSSCVFIMFFTKAMRLSHYEIPTSYCAVTVVDYLSLNGGSLETIPLNLLVRIGLRLTHSFV